MKLAERTLPSALIVACLFATASATAQAPAEPAPEAPPAAPEATSVPQEGEAAPEAEATSVPQEGQAAPEATECFPACRSGYLCHQGQCISACNPPCGRGEICTAEGECEPYVAMVPHHYAEDFAAPRPDPGAHTHDGFFLRFTLGVGGAGASVPSGTTLGDVDYSGAAGFFAFDIGGAPVENLIIHARIGGFSLDEPDVTSQAGDLGRARDTTLSFSMIGAGVTYYFMPANVYLDATLGLAGSTYRERGERPLRTQTGIALSFDIGKEWWVGEQWGLGVAARFTAVSLPQGDVWNAAGDLTGAGIGILFSATYN